MKLASLATVLSMYVLTNLTNPTNPIQNTLEAASELSQRYIHSSHYTEKTQLNELSDYLRIYENISKLDIPKLKFEREIALNNEFSETLKETIELQNFLKANFFLPKDYEANGVFDKETEKALKKFQAEANIAQTGELDKKTLRKLWFLPIKNEIKKSQKIAKGDIEMIAGIKKRLCLEGYLRRQACFSEKKENEKNDENKDSLNYHISNCLYFLDKATIDAVKVYKKLNNLPGTPKLDRSFVYHLGMSYKEKTRRIKEAVRAYSIFHIKSKGPHLIINIPEFKARFYYNGVLVQEQRVIVGKYLRKGDKHKWTTKVQSDKITHILINPPWKVPKSIQELMPNPISFIRPGPSNPLGKVAFRLRYAIHGQILHGTANNSLFEKNKRNFSHGCIRLEEIVETARIFHKLGIMKTKNLEDKLKRKRKTYKIRIKEVPLDLLYIRASALTYNNKKYPAIPNDVYRLKSSQIPDKRNRWKAIKIRAR